MRRHSHCNGHPQASKAGRPWAAVSLPARSRSGWPSCRPGSFHPHGCSRIYCRGCAAHPWKNQSLWRSIGRHHQCSSRCRRHPDPPPRPRSCKGAQACPVRRVFLWWALQSARARRLSRWSCLKACPVAQPCRPSAPAPADRRSALLCVSSWLSPFVCCTPSIPQNCFRLVTASSRAGYILFLFQHTPDLPHAVQAVAKVQLAAQTGNVGVERAGVAARAVIAPDGFVQVIPVQRLTAVAQKQQK